MLPTFALCALALLTLSPAVTRATSSDSIRAGADPPAKVLPASATTPGDPPASSPGETKAAPPSTTLAPASPPAAPATQPTPPSFHPVVPGDQGENEPSASDVALKDDPAQEMQPSPETEQDAVFRAGRATINYGTSAASGAPARCERVVRAHVVALDQVFFWNRLGAVQPQGMIFALRHNVVPTDGSNTLAPGRVRLRADKRPRPLVLRMNVGDCIQIDFQNLLNPSPVDGQQPATRTASVHVAGLQLVNSIRDDGSNVGQNPRPGGLVDPGGRITYTLYADANMKEGTHVLFSAAATTTSEGNGGQIPPGLFGAVNVEPRNAEWYRSQLSNHELRLAARRNRDGTIRRTPGGQPILNYDAVYPTWHRYRGQPILKILNRNRVIVHSDLTAIITGPNRGKFPANTYPPVGVSPNRDWPFREFTIAYHDEIGAVQAFPHFYRNETNTPNEDERLEDTLHGGRDAFAINYGTGGIGAEIIANRIGAGPMAECDECLFEEFFLSAWAVGDPAMIVDRPANSLRDDIADLPPCVIGNEGNEEEGEEREPGLRTGDCDANRRNVPPGYKATKAFFPQDPSNVYHSYLNDHTKMRVLHAGPKEHHIHHLHAHQWLKSADGDNSAYNDSQAIGPGSGHNLEIAHGGGGNRNLTPGDSIFHCHFYPHFAQGMWSLWRVHDVFEEGTVLAGDGRPAFGARALPDAEIKRGTPIPAVVPLPGSEAVNYVMAPVPEVAVSINPNTGQAVIPPGGHPGYPFFVPGIMGRRPPAPPLDLAFDAGLPRHIIFNADIKFQFQTRLDFNKEIENIMARELNEQGEPVEVEAMEYHSMPFHNSYRTDETPGPFMTNGLPPKPGAPFADPCVSDRWTRTGQQVLNVTPRFNRELTYKAVMFQFDMKLNKVGWHFPQSRIESLWSDWRRTINGEKPPEPLFFRANTDDCIVFHHANLIPRVYQLDDFQVRTPTDIVGQHIHLVKFDVTSSDGAGNGWNYEDGTLGDQEVRHRIDEINRVGGIFLANGAQRPLRREDHPVLGRPTQVTIQRWFADDVRNMGGQDRTLNSVFTHDHFGPSTHQQTGLYGALIVEEEGSDWRDNEDISIRLGYGNTNPPVAPFDDGGHGRPTSFAAIIQPPSSGGVADRSFREFVLEFQDFHLAYQEGRGGTASNPIPDPEGAINPPGRREIEIPDNNYQPGGPFGIETRLLDPPFFARNRCPNGAPAPCPEIVSAEDVGTFTVNYRNEPLALRVRQPGNDPLHGGTQAAGDQGDLSLAYKSHARADNRLNQLGPYQWPPLTPHVGIYDPFTPLLRTNEHDHVRFRILVGAHEEGHNFAVNGIKWLFEPFDPDSGFRNSQMMGISEKFDIIVPGTGPIGPPGSGLGRKDFLYRPGAAVDDQWNGLWGIMRAYQPRRAAAARSSALSAVDVTVDTEANDSSPAELPSNPASRAEARDDDFNNNFTGACPNTAPPRHFDVSAYLARDILPGGRLQFTGQNGYNFSVGGNAGPLVDPTAILFVRDEHITRGQFNRPRVEPLLLRARAGECITVTLTNRLPNEPNDLPGYNTFPMIVNMFNANQVVPSRRVGLHPQLVHYDLRTSDGMAVGNNPIEQAVPPGQSHTYRWYAGDVRLDTNGHLVVTPIEFGATNLSSSDPLKHSNKSAIGSLIIEPPGAFWSEDPDSTHSATIWPGQFNCVTEPCPQPFFREFVLQFQNDLNMRYANNNRPVPNLADDDDPEDSAQKAINFRTEPFWTRLRYPPETPLEQTRDNIMTDSLHNFQIGNRDPVTPIFTAGAGEEVRFRVLHSGGHARNNVFMTHGHIWQEMPYLSGSGSTQIGFNLTSPWHGSQWGHGPSNHFDVQLWQAGGAFGVKGDYLYRTFQSFQFDGGIWGLFRVHEPFSRTPPMSPKAVPTSPDR